MTAEQLRNSILQEAVLGHLVPQDPVDEPASTLLERVRLARESLLKEKKVKVKDIDSAPIQEDERTFELPAQWEFVRLNYVATIARGGSPRPIKEYLTDSPNGYNWIKIGDTEKGGKYINHTKERIKPEGLKKSRLIHKGDFLLTNSMSFGRPYISNIEGCIHDGWLVISPAFGEVFDKDYLYYVLSSPYVKDQFLGKVSGAVVQNLNSDKVATSVIPLPPLAEQKRIVAKLEELLPIVEQYGKAQTELDQLNAALPSRLRQSILQEAISGRLVPQDENETADGLKMQLLQAVNNSPFKKKWNSEPIEEDELPFDIPENWKWIRLGDIVYTQTGLSYSKGDLEKKVPNPIRVLRGGNIQNGAWFTKDDDVMIAPEFVKKDIFLKKNSFITPAVTSLEHLGKTALIREDHNDIVAGGFVLYLMPYDDKNDALMEYLAYFFQSAFYNSFCKTITNKSGQAFWNISREKLLKLPIPLPPLAEQQRIVAKIEELFTQIDKISK